jgi:Leucine-rich repeat (LRR) protein
MLLLEISNGLFDWISMVANALKAFHRQINLESLEVFTLSGCSRLKKFPEIVGNMSRLPELYLNETAIKTLPLSVEHLTCLITLDLRHCNNLSSFPNAICSFDIFKNSSFIWLLKT